MSSFGHTKGGVDSILSQKSARDSLEQIDVAKRLVKNYTSDLAYCEDSQCARQAFRNGRIASMLGLEGR